MANEEQLKILKQGMEAWNKWREENPSIIPDLNGAYLSKADLRESNLSEANLYEADLGEANLFRVKLFGANLREANLRGANLREANLYGEELYGADLSGADLRGANLYEADLTEVNLTGADLTWADLRKANLRGAEIRGVPLLWADLRGAGLEWANFQGSNISTIEFDRKTFCARTNINNCRIDPLFKKHVEDGNYLNEFKNKHVFIYWIWWILADCGRSISRWLLWSVVLAIGFGAMFFKLGPGAFKVDLLPWNISTMMYYSVVTFTTLGFGDIIPATNSAAWWVMGEVITGYVMLGGLISILANKLARRS